MDSFLVTCELNNRHGDYRPLFEKITSFGEPFYGFTNNVWIIKSRLSPIDISTILQSYCYQNDKILVVQLVRKAGWTGLSREEEDWLSSHL